MAVSLDEKTKISLWGVACALPFLVGAILWLVSVDSKASAAAEEVKNLRPIIMDIFVRVVRIEEQTKLKGDNK